MMEEVNARLETIFLASNGKFQMHEMLAEELCCFQLRMICETIACACLIAHGDLTADLCQLHNEWSADRIFKKLSKLHSDFYPKPRIVAYNHEMQRIDITHKTEGFLTKNDFLKLYGLTHSRSHRGSIKNMNGRPPYTTVNFNKIIGWVKKIENLLNDHIIQSPDESHTWLIIQKSSQCGGHPLVGDVKK